MPSGSRAEAVIFEIFEQNYIVMWHNKSNHADLTRPVMIDFDDYQSDVELIQLNWTDFVFFIFCQVKR